MADIDITTMSSKGQVVIPSDMRDDFKEGDKLVIIKSGKQLILKKAKDFDKQIKDDIEFARRTEQAFKKYERGEFIELDYDEFLKRAKKW